MQMRVSVIGALAMALVLLFATPGWASVSKSARSRAPTRPALPGRTRLAPRISILRAQVPKGTGTEALG